MKQQTGLDSYSLRAPQPKLDVLCGRAEVVVRAKQDQIVFQTKLDQQCVDGPDLDTTSSAGVSHFSGFNVVFAVRLEKAECCEPIDQLATRLRSSKALQQFLQYQTCRKDLISPLESVLKRFDFWCRCLGVATEGSRPNAGVD